MLNSEPSLSFFNWSLKKLLSTNDNVFERAKTKILFTILLFSQIKALATIVVTSCYGQYFQLWRSLAFLMVYIILLKVLLAGKRYMVPVTHMLVWMGIILIWSNMFFYAQKVNTITLQFVFMLILGCFYLLSARSSIIYATLSIIPVVCNLFYCNTAFGLAPEELISPGYEIIVVLNFISIILAHYLFKQAFLGNLKEKETLNEQLRQAVKDANQAAESKSDFLSTMSHELRTPLNSVIGISDILLKEPHTPEQEENLNIIKFSAGNLHTLINDILDFNKLGSGKVQLENIPVNLKELLVNLSAGLNFQARQKGIDFFLDIDEAMSGKRVITDPTRLTQIIYNLTGNAIKFTKEGYVTLKLQIIRSNESIIDLQFSIIDTGIGISPEHREAIFEPFTQASFSTTRQFGGTGLGLAIVKQLLHLFNSSVDVESATGKGSTFSFNLLLNLDISAQAGDMSGLKQTDFNLEGMKVLVAEDNPMNRLLLQKIFSKWNCQWTFAEDGQQALEKLETDNYDVILMDLHMPVLDGYNASRLIRQMSDPLKSGIPIIALTASVSGNLNEKIKASGMDGYILKPFKPDDLFYALKAAPLRVQEG